MKNVLVSSVALTLALAAFCLAAADANGAGNGERQGRSVASGSSANSLSSSNSIEHSSSKSRIEQERRQVQEFLTTKNIFKSIVKLLFGNPDEISATSRNVLGVLGKVSSASSPPPSGSETTRLTRPISTNRCSTS